MRSLLHLWKVFLQSVFVSRLGPSHRRRKQHQHSPNFSPLEPRKLLAGIGSEIVVNAVHDTLELNFDDSVVTIREAMYLANENESLTRITFAPELSGRTISVSSELIIDSSVAIDSLFDVTVSGEGETRVFHVAEGGDFSVDGITIADGASISGAAIHNDGVLTVKNTTFKGNDARFGGAILNAGALQIEDSLFVDNSASLWGSAVYTQQDENLDDFFVTVTSDIPIVGDNRDGTFNNGDQGDFVIGKIPATAAGESFSNLAIASDLNRVFQRDPVFGDGSVVDSAEAVQVGVTIDEPLDPEEPGEDCDEGHDGDPTDPDEEPVVRSVKLGYRFMDEVVPGDGGDTGDDDGAEDGDCEEGHDEGEETDGTATDGTETDGEETDGEETDGEETDGTETDGDETDGTATDGTATDGDETDGTATDGTATDGTETDGTETDGEETDGTETDGEETDGTDTGGEDDGGYEHCVPFEAVDDLKIFVAKNLAAGGPQTIDALENDCLYSTFSHTTSFTANFNDDPDHVRKPFLITNPPTGHEVEYWFDNGFGSGTYESGSFSLDLDGVYVFDENGDVVEVKDEETGDDIYDGFRGVSYAGNYAYTTYSGKMTLNAEGRAELVFPVLFNSITDRNYESPNFRDTTSGIEELVDGEQGTVHSLYVTFDTYQSNDPSPVTGEIISHGVDIIDFTQPSFGTSELAFVYTPYDDATQLVDSFAYTIASLLAEDTATITIEADPDEVSVEASDPIAWEVPPHSHLPEYNQDVATFTFSRQDRPDEPLGNNHVTTVYFTFEVPDGVDPSEDESGWASGLDWNFKDIIPGFAGLIEIEGEDVAVYTIQIPSGDTKVDMTIVTANDSDYELADEKLRVRILDCEALPDHVDYKVESEEATIEIVDRTANIDIGEEDQVTEDDPGHTLKINDDDDNMDGVPDYRGNLPDDQLFVDDDLIEVTLESLIPGDMGFDEDYFGVAFDPSLVRLWFNQDKSDGPDGVAEFTAANKFDEAGGSYTLWIEGVGFGAGVVSLIWYESESIQDLGLSGSTFDTFRYTTLGVDVDVDSDNDQIIQHSDWEDELENNLYGLGKLIKDPYTPLKIKVPDPVLLDPDATLTFDYEYNGDAGVIYLNTETSETFIAPNDPRHISPGESRSVSRFEVDASGWITLWIQAGSEAPGLGRATAR